MTLVLLTHLRLYVNFVGYIGELWGVQSLRSVDALDFRGSYTGNFSLKMSNAVCLGQERVVTCEGVSFLADEGQYAPFCANGSIHIRAQSDLLFSRLMHTFFSLPGSIQLKEGYFALCEDSPYKPRALLGHICPTPLTKNDNSVRIPFKPENSVQHEIFVPAGSVICQISPLKCTVPGCKHGSGDCV